MSDRTRLTLPVTATMALLIAFAAACARPLDQPTAISKPGTEKPSASACFAAFTESGDCVQVRWQKMPSENEIGAFEFAITKTSPLGPVKVVDASSIEVELFMPSMGHGSRPVIVSKADDGSYRAEKLYFTMSGDWEIRFIRRLPGGGSENAVHSVVVP